jgi:hypothetical protein
VRHNFACNKSPGIAFVPVHDQQEATTAGKEEMATQVGTTDRVVEIVLGVILIALGLTAVVAAGLANAAYPIGAFSPVTSVFAYYRHGQFLKSIAIR